MELNELRNSIDDIDKDILSLFEKRMDVCRQVALYKKQHDMPVFQSGREDEIIARIRRNTADPSLRNGTAALFTTIMDISKHLQLQEILSGHSLSFSEISDEQLRNAPNVACQGIAGANSETAASMIFGQRQFKFLHTFEDVFDAVENGSVDYGVIPIHNSTAGSVTQTYDLMAKYNFFIVKSVCVEIKHCLAAAKGVKLSDITQVYSHPQALSQCSGFIAKNNLKPVSYDNTATAARFAAQNGGNIAAICSHECAAKMNLDILAENIADTSPNFTKFICISKKFRLLPDADTISIILRLPNTQGSLYRLLTKFFVNGLNLDKLESRPAKDGSFEVVFYLDFKGDIKDPSVAALLAELEQNISFFKFLGSHSQS